MPFQIIRNNITRVSVDVIVNTANPQPKIGSGTDSAIYRAAGKELLLAERRKIGCIGRGEARVTPAFGLDAKYIIHTVGPSWEGGQEGEREILHACYANSLNLAAELGAESIAFPLISSGYYGFPKDEALQIALDEISRFLMTHEMQVILVVLDEKSFKLSARLVGAIDEYIDEHEAEEIRESEYPARRRREAMRRQEEEREARQDLFFGSGQTEDMPELCAAIPKASEPAEAALSQPVIRPGTSLEEFLGGAGDTFQQRLFQLIKESGMDEVSVYKRANIDRKVFSKIRCNQDYRPAKRTAVAFAIALKLDMQTMQDLLSRAEIAMSPSSIFDLIISYFITNRNYDIFQINAALFEYGQQTLGAEP